MTGYKERRYFIYVLLVGASAYYDLNLGARVPLSEIIAFSSLPLLGMRVGRDVDRDRLQRIYLILGLWIVGIILSDVVNSIPPFDFLRSLMKPIFSYLWFLVYYSLIKRHESALLVLPIGIFMASIQNYYAPQEWTAGHMEGEGYEAMAYGFFPLLNSGLIAGAIMTYPHSKRLSSMIFLGIAVINALSGGSRSTSLLNMILAVSMAVTPEKLAGKKISAHLVVGIFLVIIVTYLAYIYAAPSGLLGEYQKAKFEMQARGVFGDSPLGLLLGGRPEFYAAILALIDEPILGYGSWTAYEMSRYFQLAIHQVGISSGSASRSIADMQGGAVGHSVILVLWVENSILALTAMVLSAQIIYYVLKDALTTQSILRPVILATIIPFFWAFLFSPFSVEARSSFGLIFALYVLRYPRIQVAPQGRNDYSSKTV